METIRKVRRTRGWMALAGSAAMAAALVVVPVPYYRTVGLDVTLTLGPQASSEAQARRVAQGMKRAFGTERVAIEAEAGAAGARYVLHARVPGRSQREVERTSQAFIKALGGEDVVAEAKVTPHRERVSGSVYAMAVQKVIDIRVELGDKTEEEIEAEIRAQLAESGIENPTVEVKRTEGQTQVEISGGDSQRQFHVVQKLKGEPRELRIGFGDLDTTREPGMTDEELEAKIERQLSARGVDAKVEVEGERIEIKARKRIESEKPAP